MSVYYSCSISNTPIKNNQNVRLFFIASSRGYFEQQSAKYAGIFNGLTPNNYDGFKIIGGVGIKAKIVDDNSFEFDHKSEEANLILNLLKKSYVKTTEKDKKASITRDEFINIEAENLTFEIIEKMLYRGCFYIESLFPTGLVNFVNIMAVDEDVYQWMINQKSRLIVEVNGERKFKDFTLPQYLKNKRELLKNWLKEVDIEVEKISKDNEIYKAESCLLAKLIARSKIPLGRENEYPYIYPSRVVMSEKVADIETSEEIEEKDKEKILFKFFDNIFETKLMVEKMNQLGILIQPSLSARDESDYGEIADFHSAMAKILNKKQKTIEEM